MTEAQVIEMPRFDFSHSPVQEDVEAAFNDSPAKGGFVEKTFKPGQHDVTVGKVLSARRSDKDDTWTNLCLELQGTGEKKIRVYLQIPNTTNLLYGAKKSNLPFKTLRDFCRAIGHEITKDNYRTELKTVFSRMEKLEGMSLRITVGYPKGYVKYAGKRDDGTALFVLMDRNHEAVKDASGDELLFGDRGAAEFYAQENKIPVDKYTQVLSYAPSALGTTSKASDDIF